MKELREVVITGIGAITARGDFTLHRFENGESTPRQESAAENRFANATENFIIENFELGNYLSSAKTYLDRCSALALAGSALALRDANIAWPAADEKFGITLGTHFGCLETMKGFWDNALQKGARLANPILFSHSYINSPISLCAIEFGLKGYHSTFCANENSGLEAVRAAFDAIRLGHADAMLCGGVDAVTPTRVLCEGERIIGEAAVFFVLENSQRAISRGAQSIRLATEAHFKRTSSQISGTRAAFGNCGGAQNTLTLMAKFLPHAEFLPDKI